MKKNILLVQPQWPIPSRKKHNIHHKYFPIGLLKMSTLFKSQGHNVEFVIGVQPINMVPDEIYCTSIFTFWSKYVLLTVDSYRAMFPFAKIIVGGPLVSLLSHFDAGYLDLLKSFSGIDEFFIGLHHEAEECLPDLSLVPETKVSVLHVTRGCLRFCKPCGVKYIEPVFTYKENIEKEIIRPAIVTYDNNILGHPGIESILEQMAGARVNGKKVIFESQSGFDARLLIKKPHIARLLKKARFKRPRVAWDNGPEEFSVVEEAVRLFREAGFTNKELMVFVLYNFEHDFNAMEYKRKKLGQLGIQIADCRFRPLDSLEDNYRPGKPQGPREYFIHPLWTDYLVKEFRRRVRGQNIINRFVNKNKPFDDKAYKKFSSYSVPDVVIEEFRDYYGQQHLIQEKLVS